MGKDQIILLTGAGFTKNFGGFLSSDMWTQFFNNIQMPDVLKKLMLKGPMGDDDYFNYEYVVQAVLTEERYSEYRSVIKNIVEEAYRRQEKLVDDNLAVNKSAINNTKEFIYANISLFFTLNQDTFVEKYIRCNKEQILSIPYMKIADHDGGMEVRWQLPKQEELTGPVPLFVDETHVNYIKLHGSWNWEDSQGNKLPVIGKNKRQMIEKEPLLNEYYKLFENSLVAGKKLLVIGYSFMDKHINEVICKGLERGLTLFVIDAVLAKDFGVNMMEMPGTGLINISEISKKLRYKIWGGLSGYYQLKDVSELFADDSEGIYGVFPLLFKT